MSSTNPQNTNTEADKSAQSSSTTNSQQQQQQLPQLGALDEDDEFEEFEQQDWDQSATTLSHLKSTTSNNNNNNNPTLSMSGSGSGGNGTDHLWQDNWDDDDVEDDFSKALRAELEKNSNAMAT